MILNELKLNNFCIYRGEQEFNLVPSASRGKELLKELKAVKAADEVLNAASEFVVLDRSKRQQSVGVAAPVGLSNRNGKFCTMNPGASLYSLER